MKSTFIEKFIFDHIIEKDVKTLKLDKKMDETDLAAHKKEMYEQNLPFIPAFLLMSYLVGGLLKWIFAKDIESFSKLDTSKLRDAACCSCRGCCCSIPKSLQLCISARPGLRHRPRTRTPPLDGRRTAKRQKAHACWCPLSRQLTLRRCTCCFYGGRLSETPCSQPCPGVPHGAIKER